MKLLSLETATMNFPTIFRLSECLQTHAPFMSIKSIFNPDWLRYNLRNEFGYVARPVPNSIRNFFPSLTSICPTVEIGFDQLEASKMKEVFGDKWPYVMCVQTLATALADKLLQVLLVRVLEIQYLRTGCTLVRRKKCAGCSLFIRWLLFLATSITNSDS